MSYWNKGDNLYSPQTLPHASPQAQVDFLLKLLRIKSQKIATLEMQLDAKHIEKALIENEFNKAQKTLEEMHFWQQNRRPSLGDVSAPYLKPSETRSIFQSSNWRSWVYPITLGVLVGALLLLSLSLVVGKSVPSKLSFWGKSGEPVASPSLQTPTTGPK